MAAANPTPAATSSEWLFGTPHYGATIETTRPTKPTTSHPTTDPNPRSVR